MICSMRLYLSCILLIATSICAESTYQLIVHFAQEPRDEHQHRQWTEVVDEIVDLVKQRLQKDGYPAADIHARSYAIVRHDRDAGHFTVRLPAAVPIKIAKEYIKQAFQDKKIDVTITQDAAVRFAEREKLSAKPVEFDLAELRNLKAGITLFNAERELRHIPPTDYSAIEAKKETIAHLKRVQSILYWYQEFPTTGLRVAEQWFPPMYPFLPHMFRLWELAPAKGAGCKVGVLDTGIAAFDFSDDTTYRKNRDLEMKGDFAQLNYNIASDHGLDPLHELVNLMSSYIAKELFDHKELERLLPRWIRDFILNHHDDGIKAYLVAKGEKGLVDKGNLTELGQKALKNITTGPKGISPAGRPPRFTFKNMLVPPQKNVIVEFVPTEWQALGHGSHVASIISGGLPYGVPDKDTGIVGIAPAADVIMIKIFDEQGNSSTSCVLAGIRKALEYDVDILNLSLILEDVEDKDDLDPLFNRLLKSIPYVVAGTGNGGTATEGFPARCETVSFDVGAFDYRGNIPDFSQYEVGKGPKVVAPGDAILGAFTSDKQKSDSWYALLQGTSAASPIVAGAIALALAEFKTDFSREQLLKVFYSSTLKLKNTTSWHRKTLLGVIDIRMALFTLHVLKDLTKKLKKQMSSADIQKKFDLLLKAVTYLLVAMPDYYAKAHLNGISFNKNFMDYYEAAQQHRDKALAFMKDSFFVPATLNEAVEKIADAIIAVMTQHKRAQIGWLPNSVMQGLDALVSKQSVDLFPGLNKQQKKLLSQSERQDYWDTRISKLRPT